MPVVVYYELSRGTCALIECGRKLVHLIFLGPFDHLRYVTKGYLSTAAPNSEFFAGSVKSLKTRQPLIRPNHEAPSIYRS